ncbi:AraC family transcriptional regulator [Arcobacter sp. CECT 8983]|uniref:AraC family transcriptional regulator n=1 Tax=Arcobacter sp. CECT 8983 TaxID=2044508 RepID=UPI00100A9E8F|nr:AraC family transcriptional regulator [Arcobacter sp. CECT 8983]RXJ88479.1 AraC family transcriptional regulator [Arcobacter sp. CECT 8983]
MKKDTLKRHSQIANDVMHYIYRYISTDINLDELSMNLSISKFHMHRVFKEEFEQNIYETIKEVRLQKAASLLLTNKSSTISNIARNCGYSSQAAFIRVFKEMFKTTPKRWRNGEYKEIFLRKSLKKLDIKPKILKFQSKKAYYIRHKGTKKEFDNSWEKLNTWILIKGYKNFNKINFFHDNLALKDFENSRFVSAIIFDEELVEDSFPYLTMPEQICARFSFSGSKTEFVDFIFWVYFDWLINSGYEANTEPSFIIYKNDSYLTNEGIIDLDFYLAISM